MTLRSWSLRRSEALGDLQLNIFQSWQTCSMNSAVSFHRSVDADECLSAEQVSSEKTLNARDTFCFSVFEGLTDALVSLDNLVGCRDSIEWSSSRCRQQASLFSPVLAIKGKDKVLSLTQLFLKFFMICTVSYMRNIGSEGVVNDLKLKGTSLRVCTNCYCSVLAECFFKALVLVWAHLNFFAISLSGNIALNKSPTWSAQVAGKLCSIINCKHNTSALITELSFCAVFPPFFPSTMRPN